MFFCHPSLFSSSSSSSFSSSSSSQLSFSSFSSVFSFHFSISTSPSTTSSPPPNPYNTSNHHAQNLRVQRQERLWPFLSPPPPFPPSLLMTIMTATPCLLTSLLPFFSPLLSPYHPVLTRPSALTPPTRLFFSLCRDSGCSGNGESLSVFMFLRV